MYILCVVSPDLISSFEGIHSTNNRVLPLSIDVNLFGKYTVKPPSLTPPVPTPVPYDYLSRDGSERHTGTGPVTA